tara:strand:- start:8424 stop:8849 length:426 start_codon:yes stop_codon:yes gene_type:complete
LIKPLYEVKLYMGSVRSRPDETGEAPLTVIYKEDLIKEIGKFQDSQAGTVVTVRITDTTFVSGLNYEENGWEVAAINFPRTNHSHSKILDFMMSLARHLLCVFLQNRICVLDYNENMTDDIYMLENGEEKTTYDPDRNYEF